MTTTQPAQAIPEETPSNGTEESAPVREPADKVFNAEQNTPEPPTTTSPPDQYEGSGAVSDTEWVSHYSAQEFGLLLTRELDQDNLFRLIVSSSIKLTNATAGGLYLHGPNRSTLERVISVGSDAALVRVIVAHDKGLAGQAWELEKIVTSADSDTAAPPTSSLTPETRGNVALPLKSAGEFIGVLLLCRSWIHLELSPAEANALESLTAQSSLAIHNVQLITRERQLQLRAGALAAAAELAIQSEGLNESLIKLLEATLQAVPIADAGTVVFFDRGSAIRVAAGGEVDIIPPDFRPQYQDLCVLLGTTDGSRIIPDTQSYPEYFAESAVLRLRECRSLLLTPLLSNGTRIGILLLETGTHEDAFGQAEAGFAESIARLMVSSTVQQEQRQATLKHLLFQKTMAELYSAQVNTGTAGAFSVLVDGLRQLPYCHRVNLLFLSSGSYGPPVRYSYSAMEATPLLPDLFKLMSVPLTSGRPELIPELGPGEGTDVARECCKAGFRSLVTVPLALGTEVIGGLNLLSQSPAAFSPEDVEFLENVSAALTTRVKNERLLISEAESRQSAEALLEAARQVNATLYADVVLDRIVEQVLEIVPGDCCNVMLLSENNAQVVRSRGYRPLGVTIQGLGFKITDHANLLQMLLDGQPISVNNLHADPGLLNWYGSGSLHSYIGAPLQAGGSVIGFLNVEGTGTNQFAADATAQIKILADIAAAALQNAGLYRQLHNQAERLEAQVHERTSQLRIQYAQLETVLSATSDGMLIVANDGVILQSNPSAEYWLTGRLNRDEAAHLRQSICDVAQQADARPKQRVVLGEEQIELSAMPMLATDSGRQTAVVTLHDITHAEA